MSKKTRKKSSTTAAKKVTAKKAVRSKPVAPAKTSAAKTAKKVAKPAAKKSVKAAKTSSAKASHKPASKPLKSEPLPAPQAAPAPAAKPAAKSVTKSGLAKAPAFKLPRDGGDSVSLADYSGKKLVLFFYPRADTPGCTREAIDFTRLKSAFAESGTEVLGVSGDTVKTQESFRNKHQLSVPLISDEKHEMLQAYGVWGEKSMYGRTFMGIIRTTVLIDAEGRIARVWRNVRVDGHAEEVLSAAREALIRRVPFPKY